MAGRFWRQAASLIIIGKSSPTITSSKIKNSLYCSDYEILFLKRNSKSRFMPNAYVYPGGVVDEADFSSRWIDYFKQHGFNIDDLENYFRTPTDLDKFGKCNFSHPLPEMALRICALRETFEETGLILCRDQNIAKVNNDLSISKLKEWRKLVQGDALQFLYLCELLNVPPDIWSLHNWSSWLTPAFYGAKNRRFDTFFYLIFLDDQIPELVPDKNEMADINYMQPIEKLKSYYDGEVELAVPQVYELSRLLNFTKYSDLKSFMEDRLKEGMMDRWMPVKIKTADAFMTVLEGDDLYPEKPDYFGALEDIEINETFDQSTKSCTNLNRVRFMASQPGLVHPYVNLKSKDKYLSPINFKEIFGKG